LDFTETRESGFLRFWLPEIQNPPPAGAAEGCDPLILFLKQDQKIATFGSSYSST